MTPSDTVRRAPVRPAPTTSDPAAASAKDAAARNPAPQTAAESDPAPVPGIVPDPAVVRRGRPRDASVARAVADAVLRMVAEGATFGELSMEGIARAAGVGKATVYRRWPNKDALLLDVIACGETPLPEEGTGVLRDDLISAVEYIRRRSLAKRESALMRSMLMQAQANTVLWQRYHDTVVAGRRRMLVELLEHGIASGEIRPELGADLDLLCDMVVGPVLARATLRPGAALPADLAARVVDMLLDGMRPRD